jgi:hypothetical protein
MNCIAKLAILVFVACTALPGQEKATAANANVVRAIGHESEIFLVKHRNPFDIVKIINVLKSDSKDAMMEAHFMDGDDIKAIMVRDFPENIATIKAAIEKLDIPSLEFTPVELTLYVIWASKKEIADVPVASNYSDVVNEVSKIFDFKHFREAAVITHITKDNNAIGKATFGFPGAKGAKYLLPFVWEMRADNANRCDECIVSSWFNIRYGYDKDGISSIQQIQISGAYVNLKNNEKVLLGTTSIGDLAMIVVVSAKAVSSF